MLEYAAVFQRANGFAHEKLLDSVVMPNQHVLHFQWNGGQFSYQDTNNPPNQFAGSPGAAMQTTGAAADNLSYYRITGIADGRNANSQITAGRVVTYGYDTTICGLPVTSVTTPGTDSTHTRLTAYGYGGPAYPASGSDIVGAEKPKNLLTSITDPRGLTSYIVYGMDHVDLMPYGVVIGDPTIQGTLFPNPAPIVYELIAPTGNTTMFVYGTGMATTPFGVPQTQPLAGGIYEFSGAPTMQQNGTSYDLPNCTQITLVAGGPEQNQQSFMQTSLVPPPANGGTYSLQLPIYSGEPFFSQSIKHYDAFAQDLYENDSTIMRTSSDGKWASDQLFPVGGLDNNGAATRDFQWTVTKATYNFQANPLWQQVQQYTTDNLTTEANVLSPVTTSTTEYAYWDKTKYYQQKAVVDRIVDSTSVGRTSYTDYYTWNDSNYGNRGKVYKTYNSAIASFTNTRNTDSTWRGDIAPASGATYASTINYDSKGRPTDTWILHSTSPSAAYVQTHMTYLADGPNTWGEPGTVVEDYGTGKINRTTTTNAYDAAGRATDTTDAAGHEFRTTYNPDGSVSTVYQVDHSLNTQIASYTYSTTPGASYGQPLSVVDGLSGVTDSFTYSGTAGYHYDNVNHVWVGGGGDVGQVTSVAEAWPHAAWWPTTSTTAYSVGYSYTPNGERNVVTYTTPVNTQRWQYADYCSVGQPSGPSRAFQTLRQLDSSSNPTYEEMHYQFDGGGRLEASGFAQLQATGFTPSSGQPFYDNTHLARTRARVYYNNDARGCMSDLVYLWDTYGSGAYTSTAIQSYHCGYDSLTAQKTSSTVYTGSTSTGMNWTTGAQESYGYDAQRDFLTNWTTTNDSLGNQSKTWSYDAAGNRNDVTVVDNLNRATTIGGTSYTNDILGNRLTKGSTPMTWDSLSRLTAFNTSNTYSYRADGLRTRKFQNSNTTSTMYCYDGQMGFEDISYTTSNSGTSMTLSNYSDYALGARGVDRWTTSSNSGVYFPIYDPHGNQVTYISRSGASYWEAGTQRVNDPWGNLRGGGAGFAPYNRYCGNLEHKNDDETGLTYMRARYYDQSCGRFISEDPGRQGLNWLVYAGNKPSCAADPSGRAFGSDDAVAIGFCLIAALIAGILTYYSSSGDGMATARAVIESLTTAAAALGEFAGYEWDGVLLGGIAGAISGAIDAKCAGLGIWGIVGWALAGAIFGAIGGAVGIAAAIEEKQIGVLLLLSGDEGLVWGDAENYGTILEHR